MGDQLMTELDFKDILVYVVKADCLSKMSKQKYWDPDITIGVFPILDTTSIYASDK